MNRRAGLVLLAASFWVNVSAAQQAASDEGPFSGSAALGYLSTSGNTDSTNINAAFQLLWQRTNWSHEFDLSAVSADANGVKTADAQTASYAGRREFGEHAYLFTGLDWDKDKFSAFDRQVSETVGYGRHVIATEKHAFNLEGGVGARRSTWRDGTKVNDSIVRLKADYTWSISDTTEFKQDFVVEDGSSNTSTRAVTELRAKLFGDFSLVLSYRIKHNSDVLPGTQKTDRFTAISLEYAF